LRKHSAFVIDQELKSQQEARADTPHLSEISPGEDVSADVFGLQDLGVQDLGIGNEAVGISEEDDSTDCTPNLAFCPDEEKLKKSGIFTSCGRNHE
jgi:hypothetical protein